MPLSPGTLLRRYEIAGLLGAGGMGEIHRARDARLDRTVAIKILPEHLATDPSFKSRFEREVRAVSAWSHPHLCTPSDIGEPDGMLGLPTNRVNRVVQKSLSRHSRIGGRPMAGLPVRRAIGDLEGRRQGDLLLQSREHTDGPRGTHRRGFDVGAPHPLFKAQLRATTARNYDVTPDGKRFLVNGPKENDRSGQSVMLVLNWPAALKK